jgi:superfamily II RNA helicase
VTPSPLQIRELFDFPLDDFQLEAAQHIDAGHNVIVCAPTGAGKTAVAEYAVHRALADGHRLFYTTPLKALSNQKFYDFRDRLGADRVGLLTGDISILRDAPVVVMTTEVFRNMLYGTTLGEVSRNLERVRYVVLDECHFMNDVDRGTVWEESVIYAPRDVALVALSATIANAPDLREWMEEVHGPTRLCQTSYRPVPLRHYYFTRGQLLRLAEPSGRLNPAISRLQGAKVAAPPRKGKRLAGDRGRTQPSAPRPELDEVCRSLDEAGMLPAIFFVFSRKGCEDALRRCEGSVTMSAQEENLLSMAIDEAIDATPSLATHPHLPYLYAGVAAHHAGLLPSWKNLVERLFVRGLVKAVFATETLAAGINMPARTTVITAISKRCDEGHRLLTGSEFLQMSGRAGRRGMDTVGHVVTVSHPRESAEDAGKLARADADPLVSQFTPTYGMVLNLLQRHSLEQCHQLLERSFGQFTANRQASSRTESVDELDGRIRRLSQPLCPGERGDLNAYRHLYEQLRVLRRQAKQLKPARGAGRPAPEVATAAQALLDQAAVRLEEARRMPCHGCSVQEACARQEDDLRKLEARRLDLRRRIYRTNTPYKRQFEDLAAVLEDAGYLRHNIPTASGCTAAALRATNVVYLAEVLRAGVLESLDPVDAAAVLTALITEESRRTEPTGILLSETAEDALRACVTIARKVDRLQRRHGVEVPVVVVPIYAGLAQEWARGTSWDALRAMAPFDEGDLVRCLRRSIDLARQIARAPGVSQATSMICNQVESMLARDEIRDEFLAQEIPTEPEAILGESGSQQLIEMLEELIEEDTTNQEG